jgi:hypothetical protein
MHRNHATREWSADGRMASEIGFKTIFDICLLRRQNLRTGDEL